jgi:Zn-dependent protease with chaperone function
VVLASSLIASFVLGHSHVAMRTWTVLAMAISLAPVGVWAFTRYRERRASAAAYRLGRQAAAAAAARLTDSKEPALGPQPTPAPSVSGTTTGGN